MGAYKYYNPSTQQWEIVKSKSIIKPDGSLEYTPDDIKDIDDKIDILSGTSGTKEKANKEDLDSHLADGASHSKTARFVVGTSTAGWTSKDVDYLCDGTNDQEEIIQALNALPATGGEVVILDGTYNITASINIPKD
ncbi:TPA: hypothetical protein GXZ34_04930, partial [bacterium]|nr:hypothetical protein [bacterium]